MSLITLFDKSFLQALSVDESVWFDRFCLAVVCPVFYAETLGDLAKEPTARGPAERIVRNIAEKFPEMGGSPCAFHFDLCVQDLLGRHIPLDGRIPRAGGRAVKSGIVYSEAFEEAAFHRWQQGEFAHVERLIAAAWRSRLSALDLGAVAKTLRGLGVDGKACKSLEDARDIASGVITGTDKPYERLKLGILFFDIPQRLHAPVIEAWKAAGQPPLVNYAPYAAFVLTVEIFFQIALAAGLISTERPSNRTDIAYLFYLPFSQAFVSSDKLHRRCAPLFLRDNQEFIWGPDLKAGLKELNDHYLALPESEREKGVYSFAGQPPVGTFVASIWDRHMRPDYRKKDDVPLDPAAKEKLLERFKAFRNLPSLPPEEIEPEDNHEMLTIERHVRKKRGSWWQVPKDLPDPRGE